MKTIELSPRRDIGVTADTHWNEKGIIRYCKRPWLSEAELARVEANEEFNVSAETLRAHDAGIVAGINCTIGKGGILIIVGDIAAEGKVQQFRDKLLVEEIYAIVGNHDDEDELVAVFGRDRVFERVIFNVGGVKAVADHYPGDSWIQSHKGVLQFFGHCHGASNARRRQSPAWHNSIDCGVDGHGFRPWLWRKELMPLFAKRRQEWEDWRDRTYTGKNRGGMAPVGEVEPGLQVPIVTGVPEGVPEIDVAGILSPLRTLWRDATRVWAEDEATIRDPDHVSLEAALRRHLGVSRDERIVGEWAVESEDWGDATCIRTSTGYLVMSSYPGANEIRKIRE